MKKFGFLSLAIVVGVLLLFSREATATKETKSRDRSVLTVSSYFDNTELDDWTVNFGTLTNPGSGGLGGGDNNGHITTDPPGEGKTSYYIAPPKYYGDWRNSELKFALWSSGGDYYSSGFSSYGDVYLANGSMEMSLILPERPPETWSLYSISFDDTENWDLRGGATILDDILSNVTEFQIRAEYGNGVDSSGLDNVELFGVMPSAKCDAAIRSIANGDWNASTTWQPNRIPNENDIIWIQPNHTITGPSQATDIQGLCNEGTLRSQQNRALRLVASGLISNTGQITGLDGSDSDTENQAGRQGSSLTLRGSPVYNEGTIQAGSGGEGPAQGGKGGSVKVIGRDVTNHGTICAGRGGNVAGTAAGTAGQGGDTHIRGNRGGDGTLLNDGLLCAGDGGQGNTAATQPQDGGDGGCLKLVARPVLLSNGQHYAGFGGAGSGGGQPGLDGCVVIDPILIDLSGNETEVRGGTIRVSGGQDWISDLRSLKPVAISATQSITLSTGTGGAVDLRDNNTTIIQAAGPVLIATDVISLDGGVTLDDLISAEGGVADEGSKIVYDTAVSGPGQVGVFPGGGTVSLPVTLFNNGPAADTYTLTASDVLGWSLSGLPNNISVEALDLEDLMLDIDIPADVPLQTVNTVSVTVASQADPSQTSTTQIEVEVSLLEGETTYLPLILK